MRNITVTLTTVEMMVAGVVGAARRVASTQNGNDKYKHAEVSDWATDIDGVMAEMAIAKHLGVYWVPTVNTFKEPDLCGFIQARSTRHQNGRLIVRRNDKDHETFVLVITTEAPNCMLVGSLLGAEAKRDEWFRTDCWWVPQDRLGDLPTNAQ